MVGFCGTECSGILESRQNTNNGLGYQDDVQFIFLYVFSVLLLLYSMLPF